MDDLERFCCQNPDCPDVGKRGHGNLSVTSRYGPGKSRRMLRCSTCKKRFSQRKGTPLFDSRLPPERVVAILSHVAEGNRTRKTARLTGSRYGHPIHPKGWGPSPPTPQRVGGFFPRRRVKSSSMRNNRSSVRMKRPVNRTTKSLGIAGTMWRSTRKAV